MHRKRPINPTTISRKLVSDTTQYLQTLSDRILISDAVSSRNWDTTHLATQLLQSRCEVMIVRQEMETDAVSESTFLPTQPEEKCRK